MAIRVFLGGWCWGFRAEALAWWFLLVPQVWLPFWSSVLLAFAVASLFGWWFLFCVGLFWCEALGLRFASCSLFCWSLSLGAWCFLVFRCGLKALSANYQGISFVKFLGGVCWLLLL